MFLPGRSPDGFGLTVREADVLRLLAKGYSYASAAANLGIHVGTVQSHVKSIYRKLGVSSKTEAAFVAITSGLLELPTWALRDSPGTAPTR